MRPRVSHGVAAAAALGALTIGGVAAAAYTGSLPTSIQRIAHDHLGAPHPRHPKTTALAGSSPAQSSSLAVRSTIPTGHPAPPGLSALTPHPTPSGPKRQTTPAAPSALGDRDQLCTAYSRARAQSDGHAVDNAWRKLEKAAGGPQNVSAFCAPVWATGTATPNPEPHDSPYPDQHPPLTSVPANPPGQQSD